MNNRRSYALFTDGAWVVGVGGEFKAEGGFGVRGSRSMVQGPGSGFRVSG